VFFKQFLCLRHILNVQIYHVSTYSGIVSLLLGSILKARLKTKAIEKIIEVNIFMFESDSAILFQILNYAQICIYFWCTYESMGNFAICCTCLFI
jgi:hypothetical protein